MRQRARGDPSGASTVLPNTRRADCGTEGEPGCVPLCGVRVVSSGLVCSGQRFPGHWFGGHSSHHATSFAPSSVKRPSRFRGRLGPVTLVHLLTAVELDPVDEHEPEFLDGGQAAHPEQLLLERADHPLGCPPRSTEHLSNLTGAYDSYTTSRAATIVLCRSRVTMADLGPSTGVSSASDQVQCTGLGR